MSSTPRWRLHASRRRRGGPTGPGWPVCGSCCSRPASSTPRRGGGGGPAAWSSASPRSRWPTRSGGRCCATSRSAPRCCARSRWRSLVNDLLPFAEYLTAHHPGVTSLRELDRACIEGYLAWNRTRGWRGQRAAAGAGPGRLRRGRPVGGAEPAQPARRHHRLGLGSRPHPGGWSSPPTSPNSTSRCPAPWPPDVDAAVMNAVAGLDDPFARVGLTVLRGAGLRVGELLDLELGSIIDYGPAGTWLKVPLGKLATERMVPPRRRHPRRARRVGRTRGTHRPMPHPRTGVLTDFLFTQHGRRLGLHPAAQRAARRRRSRRAARARRRRARRHAPSAAPHLGHRTRQRRDEPAGA